MEGEGKIWMMHVTLKDLGRILLYLLATLVLGALLAPILFHGAQWLAEQGVLPWLKTQPFRRFFNRSVQVSAILLLWPLAKSFRIRTIAELGLRPDPLWWRRWLTGVFAAVILMLAMCAAVYGFGGIQFLEPAARRLGELRKVLVTAVAVGVLEECLFRGAFLGIFQRTMGIRAALFVSSAFFSVLHFIKPITITVAPSDVNWLSGFALIPVAFSQWSDPAMIGALFTTLFAVGWVLGWATQRTQSLWMSIGLHSGWVLCAQGFGKFARFAEGGLPWMGTDLRIGIAPLVTVLLTGALCWLSLSHGTRPNRS